MYAHVRLDATNPIPTNYQTIPSQHYRHNMLYYQNSNKRNVIHFFSAQPKPIYTDSNPCMLARTISYNTSPTTDTLLITPQYSHILYFCSTSQLPLQIALQATIKPSLSKPVPKAHSNRREQTNAQERRAPLVVIHDGSPFPDFAHAPKI